MGSVYSITGEAEEALAAATAETVLQLIGHASVKARIIEWGVSFDGVSAVAELNSQSGSASQSTASQGVPGDSPRSLVLE